MPEPKQTLSPRPKLPVSPVGMDFPDAMRAVIGGKKVTKLGWNNSDFVVLKDGVLQIRRAGKFHSWGPINDGDLLGTDWAVLPEQKAMNQ